MSQPLNLGQIVLIEDNPPIARLVRTILVGAGLRLEVANDGASGIALVEKHRPDVVLCDLDLADMDGFQVLKEIRSREGIKGSCVIAFTVFTMDDDRRQIDEAGFDGCIVKPLEPQDFLRDVMSFVRHCSHSNG